MPVWLPQLLLVSSSLCPQLLLSLICVDALILPNTITCASVHKYFYVKRMLCMTVVCLHSPFTQSHAQTETRIGKKSAWLQNHNKDSHFKRKKIGHYFEMRLKPIDEVSHIKKITWTNFKMICEYRSSSPIT